MFVSADGFFEGPNHDISWHNFDEEFGDLSIRQLNEIDAIMFGRATYEVMARYWPTDIGRRDSPVIAQMMNNKPKFVFSRTLEKADWQNTTLIKDKVAEEVRKIKEEPGKDIAIFGSSNLCVSFLEMGLLDELRIVVNPVVLGDGTRLFQGLRNKINLRLDKATPFKNGNVLLQYHPA
jgi:dihydrofolate reductase